MKKFTLLAASALVSMAATAQTVVGLERTQTDFVYEAFTSTDAFVKSADGLDVTFYESDEMAARRTTSNEAVLYLHGVDATTDFAWNLQCTAPGWYGALGHDADAKFPEGYSFGFNLDVNEGKRLQVEAVELDLLFNAWGTWRVRIVDADGTELYNSGNMDKYGTLTNYLSSGSYALITADEFTMTYTYDPYEGQNEDAAVEKVDLAMAAGFQLLPSDLTLGEGQYTVILDFDFANKAEKQLSFDRFNIAGTLSDDVLTAISTVKANTADAATFNLNGQRIAAPTSGQLYIKNGKKHMAR